MNPGIFPGMLHGCLLLTVLLFLVPAFGQTGFTNRWTKPTSGNWDDASGWSLGVLPNSSHSVLITNSGWKAVAINPSTPVNFPGTMTVDTLTIRGAWDTKNALLLNYAGTTTPLRVLRELNIDADGRLVMLYSGLRVDGVLHLQGELDQEGGQLAFTSSTMQIEGGRFNLTNGVVNGFSIYLGGTGDGYMNHDSGVVALTNWLALGAKAGAGPTGSDGTYVLRNGWLMVGVHEAVGHHGVGTLIQEGGTNTAPSIAVGKGQYLKNGGGLFAGELRILSPSLVPRPNMIHAGGTATISNALRVVGGDRLGPEPVRFDMVGGSLSARHIQLEHAGTFTQSNGTVNLAGELLIYTSGWRSRSDYYLYGGNLSASRTTISWSCSVNQSGGTHSVSNELWMSGYEAVYRFSGGSLNSRNIRLSGTLPYASQFLIVGAPPFAITNENISLTGGSIDIRDSAQRFGRLTIGGDSMLNLGGNSAILRFANSHTNKWDSSQLGGGPPLTVYNWNGAPDGGGADQLRFGNSQSALTPAQVSQIEFVDPAGMPSGTYPARILATGEVVPGPRPALNAKRSSSGIVIKWSGDYKLFSSTNVLGPYSVVSQAASPYAVPFTNRHRFFFLRSP